MKRADLKVGMAVENKRGNTYVVVDTGGWSKKYAYRVDATGVEYDGIPVVSSANPVDVDGRVGVLVVGQHWITGIKNGDPMAGTTLQGEAMLPQHLYPEGTYKQGIKDRQAAMEASVKADEHRDRELVELAQRYWGDRPYLISTAGVTLDGGLLTERERQTLVTLVLAGQNR